jgi:hypothetical protein
MTHGTKRDLMGDAWAPIKSVDGNWRTRADDIAPMISCQAVGGGDRKTLNL